MQEENHVYVYVYVYAHAREEEVQVMEIIGEDGFPIPEKKTDRKGSFICICAICMGANATMKVAKTGNWIVRCYNCKTLMYLNDVTSINLFRGLQTFLEQNPEHQITHTTGILTHAPDEGT